MTRTGPAPASTSPPVTVFILIPSISKRPLHYLHRHRTVPQRGRRASGRARPTGVPGGMANTTYWVVFDPKVRGRMWSVNSYTHDLAASEDVAALLRARLTKAECAAAMTAAGPGRSRIPEWMRPQPRTSCLIRRARWTHAFFTWPDSAAEFTRAPTADTPGALKNQGITQTEPFAWRLARASNGTLYVVVARRSEDGSIGNAGDGAL